MHKAKEILDSMVKDYSATNNPEVVLCSVFERETEFVELQYDAGKIRVRADNPFSAIFGWKRAVAAVESGYIRECLGKSQPRFSLRPIKSENISEVIMNGYNAVVVETAENAEKFSEYGLKIICPWEEGMDLNKIDFLLVESEFHKLKVPENMTRIEVIEEELRTWEDRVRGICGLIFEFPHKGIREDLWVKWFMRLCLVAEKGTTLAFSTKCPQIWEALRKSIDVIHTPLMPIIETDDESAPVSKMVGHNFCGTLKLKDENDIKMAQRS
ncbi:MAG: hypothetical protein K940chlam3_01702 [Chlamydiae bacterium]|nr:hypothetical protein [Chlamydiota bacterium]